MQKIIKRIVNRIAAYSKSDSEYLINEDWRYESLDKVFDKWLELEGIEKDKISLSDLNDIIKTFTKFDDLEDMIDDSPDIRDRILEIVKGRVYGQKLYKEMQKHTDFAEEEVKMKEEGN